MSIIISTIGRATEDLCQGAALPQRQTGRRSTARQCTTLVDVRLEVDAGRQRIKKMHNPNICCGSDNLHYRNLPDGRVFASGSQVDCFLADRQPQKPFAVESAPPLSGVYLNKSQVVIRSGAQRFGHSRKSIEHALHKILGCLKLLREDN
jgi:hypothetical protein